MAAILGEIKIFGIMCKINQQRYPVGQKFRQNRYILHGSRAFLCFAIFLQKNSKIQNGCHFLRDKMFLKIGMATLQRYPVGQNFVEIAPSRTVFEI